MSETYREVFGEILADHHEAPRNWGKTEGAVHEHGYNPLCGDKIDLYVSSDASHQVHVSFEGEGCSICMASASILTEKVNSGTKEDALKWIEAFRSKMQGALDADASIAVLPKEDSGDDLTALYGVKRFPVRIKCALLPWVTLKKALEKSSGGIGL